MDPVFLLLLSGNCSHYLSIALHFHVLAPWIIPTFKPHQQPFCCHCQIYASHPIKLDLLIRFGQFCLFHLSFYKVGHYHWTGFIHMVSHWHSIYGGEPCILVNREAPQRQDEMVPFCPHSCQAAWGQIPDCYFQDPAALPNHVTDLTRAILMVYSGLHVGWGYM